jgi:NAD(P)H-flavin reductase
MYTKSLHNPASHTPPTDEWMPTLYRIKDKSVENERMITLTYEPDGQHSIEQMRPGQFNMLYAFGIGEIPISVSSLLTGSEYLTHTIQDVGAVSHALCSMQVGDTIGVRGPFGTSWPVEDALYKDVIIMAGGVGFAPLRPVIEKITLERENYGEVNFLYGTREPADIIFHKDVISLQSDPSINFLITVDHSYSNWRGNVGVVTNLIHQAEFDPDNTLVFLCGPEIMMRYGAQALMESGIDPSQIIVSMERNMKCGIGHCGHCQYGPQFICKDGPVFPYTSVMDSLKIFEL